jgi:hypothetical protein
MKYRSHSDLEHGEHITGFGTMDFYLQGQISVWNKGTSRKMMYASSAFVI